jgi:hypothetical protein
MSGKQKNQKQIGSSAERLLAHSFTFRKLKFLLTQEKFRSAINKVETLKDAKRIIQMGDKLLQENA